MCYHKLSTLAGLACLVSALFCIIAVSTPDWTMVAADETDSTDRAQYGNCALSGGDINEDRDTCAKCTRSNLCGWDSAFGVCQKQVGQIGKQNCATEEWICDRTTCA